MKYGFGGELWTSIKMNKWVLEQITPKTSPEATMTKWKLSHFGHIMRRHGFMEKAIILGKTEGSRKRGRHNMNGLTP